MKLMNSYRNVEYINLNNGFRECIEPSFPTIEILYEKYENYRGHTFKIQLLELFKATSWGLQSNGYSVHILDIVEPSLKLVQSVHMGFFQSLGTFKYSIESIQYILNIWQDLYL